VIEALVLVLVVAAWLAVAAYLALVIYERRQRNRKDD
jgi:hypothetical protein